jgi:uncharacterized phage-associated protein
MSRYSCHSWQVTWCALSPLKVPVMEYPISTKSFANMILDWADDMGIIITPMKLQKLIYFCHADFLVRTGQPLVDQQFEAWEYGPVIPSIFQEFKSFGAGKITKRAVAFDPLSCQVYQAPIVPLGPDQVAVRQSFDVYSRYTASALSNISHTERGPWAEALRRFHEGSIRGRTIDNCLIAKCHRSPGGSLVH